MHNVYKIINKINEKIYIGITKHSLQRRFTQHCKAAFTDNSHCLIHKALRKYGKDNFNIELIEQVETEEEAKQREIFWIKQYDSNNSNNGYNLTPGGDDNSHLIGEDSPVHKLTWSQVYAIINLLKTSQLTYKQIVENLKLPVSEHTIYYINNGQQWFIETENYPIRDNSKSVSKLGSNNPSAKLTEQDVLEIIDRLLNTKQTQTAMAKDFNVSYNTINLINTCKIWTNLHSYKENIRKKL